MVLSEDLTNTFDNLLELKANSNKTFTHSFISNFLCWTFHGQLSAGNKNFLSKHQKSDVNTCMYCVKSVT